MSEPYVGEVRIVGFNFAPNGWAFCDGSVMPIDQNTTLFSLIGTTYGGDGQQTFAVPNLLGRVPIHPGPGYVMGQFGGTESVTLNAAQTPAHTHALGATALAATSSNPKGDIPAASAVNVYAPAANLVTTSAPSTSDGGSQPHTNMMPFVCVNYVISLFGVYPSQN